MAATVFKPCFALVSSRKDLTLNADDEGIVISVKSAHDDSAIRMTLTDEVAMELAADIIKVQFERVSNAAAKNAPGTFKVIHTSPPTPFASINDLLDDIFKPKKVSGL